MSKYLFNKWLAQGFQVLLSRLYGINITLSKPTSTDSLMLQLLHNYEEYQKPYITTNINAVINVNKPAFIKLIWVQEYALRITLILQI